MKAPKISEVVNESKLITGRYYRFYADGSIDLSVDGKKFYWSGEVETVEEEGNIIWNHYNEMTQENEENKDTVACKFCSNDSRGSN